MFFYQSWTYGEKKKSQTFLLIQCEMNVTRNSFCWEPLDLINILQVTQLQSLALKDSAEK